MSRFLVLNGPNLDMLGMRKPEVYGRKTLADIEALVRDRAGELGVEVEFAQSNHEGELIDRIHAARGVMDGLVLNAGGLAHTSVVLRDAVEASEVPMVEVHLTNVHARESFRHRLLLAPIAIGVIAGLGPMGYVFALDALAENAGRDTVRDQGR